jgi:hypothetical protein
MLSFRYRETARLFVAHGKVWFRSDPSFILICRSDPSWRVGEIGGQRPSPAKTYPGGKYQKGGDGTELSY